MANEISFTASLTITKPSVLPTPLNMAVTNLLKSMGGNFAIQDSMSVPITSTAVPLGSVTTPHWAVFVNMDPANYIQLYNGVAGAVFARLLGGTPFGDWAIVPLDPACVPFAIANTQACQMAYLIASL